MQTFLPCSSFYESARILDYRRLGKQRVEAMQIINAITGVPRKDGKVYKGWVNHPCSVMWRNHVEALKHYCNVMIEEWIRRGYNNTMSIYKVNYHELEDNLPLWMGTESFHASHRSNLLRKDTAYYSQFNWKDNPDDPYMWQDESGNWYKQHVGTGEKEYI
tara:strand:- start:147 stop:629 length:483 start_codon:yes stop_codon:yes gene_type:complete